VPRVFYLYVLSRFASSTAMTLLRAAIAWHVFELTHSAFYLGLVGIVSFVPTLAFTLVGGAVADSFDRRRVINVAQLVLMAAGSLLLHSARAGSAALPEIFIAIVCGAIASSFEAPARIALLPAMVPRDRFPRAVTISSTGTALAFASGPALAGSLIALAGIGAAYTAYLVLVALAFLGVSRLTLAAAPVERRAVSVQAIREGLVFVWKQPLILGCMSLDMFAVVFGGASALLPIYAKTILHAGPRGYGLLTASFEIGALAMSVFLMLRQPARNAGRILLSAVGVFGAATIVFGLSRVFALSVAVYLIAGMADQISVVMRSTAIQLSTPDELRGRVSAVNMLFIGASNQLGAAESGFVAHLLSPTFAVVSGGIACLLVVAVMAWRLPELRRYRLG
jgi:MFS family permease